MNKYYRVVELGKNGEIKSLFHSTKGSRVLPMGEWIKSDYKLVRDGTGGRWYYSGFHLFASKADAMSFVATALTKVRGRAIVSCLAKGLWEKDRTFFKTYLAEQIKVLKIEEVL